MILATNNKGKQNEIKKIFEGYDIYTLSEKGILVDVEENKDTFYGNALKKATEIYDIVKEPVIADDSGLCIDIFDGWPGVFTHRFLGEDATDDERNNAILERMKDCIDSQRTARVMCDIVYYDGINTIVGEGSLIGKIADNRRGDNGFGFDDIFEIKDGRTLAELSNDEKNQISARYLALTDLKNKLSKTDQFNKIKIISQKN